MDYPADPDILIEQHDHQVAIIRLNRPARLNAFTRDMVVGFNRHLDDISANRACRVVILTGVGRGFCSGQDVKQADARNRAAPTGLVERMYWQEQFAGMGARIRAMPQIVVAAVNGACVGAGMALALAADVRIMSRGARFEIASVRLGLTAGESGISYFLPRLIGAARAFDIMLTGRAIDAEEAFRIGLAARLAEPDLLMDEALDWTRLMLANSPFATAHTKRLMWNNLDAGFAAAIETENRTQILASMTDDYKEATAAFADKRPPVFRGE